MDQLAEIRAFEAELDAELASRPLLRANATDAVIDCMGAATFARSKPETYALGLQLELGLKILLPELYRRNGREPVNHSSIVADLVFMSHYYHTREFLYYTYNATDSFDWTFSSSSVNIKFKDASIRRQFALVMNSAINISLESIEQRDKIATELQNLLRGAEELGAGEHIDRALDLALTEANIRMESQFDMFGGEESDVQFPSYSYSALFQVVRYLLAKALYHRHYAHANSTWPAFRFNRSGLVHEISLNTGVDQLYVESIVGDLAYSEANRSMPPMYFGLIETPNKAEILMSPDQFVEHNCLAQILRVHATRSPDWFSSRLSKRLGEQFNEAVARNFESAGFTVLRNISLSKIDPSAPDIDVLAISPEPTLGYYVFQCETKGSIPGFWAKDYLRMLHPNSIPKAFDQVERIARVLGSEKGQRFFVDLVMRAASTPVTEGLLVSRSIIVTSQNSGMFFSEDEDQKTVIDYRTLAYLLRRCDGDVVYLLHAFKDIHELLGADAPATCNFTVGNRQVNYEGQTFGPESLVRFRQNVWRSDGSDVRVGREFFESGGSPFDVLNSDQEAEGK